jgi:hypothetical protein
MASSDQDGLARSLVDELEARGAPDGMWLLDIAQVRNALRDADRLLLRMEDAIARQAATSAGDRA